MRKQISTPEELVAIFSQILAGPSSNQGAIITLVVSRGESPKLISGRIRMEETIICPRSNHVYANAYLLEAWLDCTEVKSWIETAIVGQAKIGDVSVPGRYKYSSIDYGVAGSYNDGDWSKDIIFCQLDDLTNVEISTTPLVMPKQPPFRSIADAARVWVEERVDDNYSSNLRHPGSLVIEIPDRRARIRTAVFQSSYVDVAIESNSENQSLELQYQARPHLQLSSSFIVNPKKKLKVRVPAETQEISLFLITDTSELISRVELSRHSPIFGDVRIQKKRSLSASAAAEIRGGETETCEFKPFLDPGDKNKWIEVVRGVIALANARGGRIYIGVNDYGDLEGDQALRRYYKSDSIKAAQRHCKILKKHISDCIVPIPKVEMTTVTAEENPIVVVTVSPSRAEVHSMQGRDVFTRIGATNRRLDTRELGQLFSRKKSATETTAHLQ